MNEKNNVNLEGVIIECSLGQNDEKKIQYANMIICTLHKRTDNNVDKTYHKVRFAVSSKNAKVIEKINYDCLTNKSKLSDSEPLKGLIKNYISLNGELRHDNKDQPFILAKEQDVNFPQKLQKNKNQIVLEGQYVRTEHTSPIAATVLLEITNGKNSKSYVRVAIDAKKNPVEWAAVTAGTISEKDTIKVSGKLDARVYGRGPDDMLMKIMVKSESLTIKNNLKKQTKTTPKL